MFTTTIFTLLTLIVVIVHGFAVTGTQGGVNNLTGSRPLRMDIEKFKYAGPAWDLYILALQHFYQTNQSEQLSYYQIAGIHGFPNVAWDGVTGNGGGVGYCTHGSILFPMWHRPYLALFENMLWNNAQQIAAQYPYSQRAKYQAAAVTMRIPYWDWSLNDTMPDVTTNSKISVNTPGGFIIIDNPLYNYTFHPLVPADLPELAQYPTTVRSPNPTTKQSEEELSNAALSSYGSYWHDSTYLLFSSQPDYQGFSNVYGGADNNIENIHGGIHNTVGGSDPGVGHMTLLWYSSMDPIFWLHHVNVDRITALWQAIYPDSYVVPQASQLESTYFTAINTVENITTPLAPFHSDNAGHLHTSMTVRYMKPFGYSYPEILDWTTSSPQELSAQVTQTVNGLYHPSFSYPGKLRRRGGHKQPVGAALAADREWVLSLRIDRTVLTEPTTLYFFAGNVSSSDPTTWATLPQLIGSQVLHPAPIVNQSTGRRHSTRFSPPTSSIPLTESLLSLHNLEPDTVLPWIHSSIVWGSLSMGDAGSVGNGTEEGPVGKRVIFNTGGGDNDQGKTRKALKTVALLRGAVKVVLKARTVTQPSNKTAFPKYGKWKKYGNVTLSGSGGLLFSGS